MKVGATFVGDLPVPLAPRTPEPESQLRDDV